MPVICGIGHDKDVPLASLTADVMVSTPTAVTVALNKSWDTAIAAIQAFERDIMHAYYKALSEKRYYAEELSARLQRRAGLIFKRFESLTHQLIARFAAVGYALKEVEGRVNLASQTILGNFEKSAAWLHERLEASEKRLGVLDPARQLRLGYSIVSAKGAVVRSVKQIVKDDELAILVADGTIHSRVI
jgi:exodeoxyribonuclease VII large subunit